eukprot:TRINITY_DN17206_c0_g1_i1.p1 TRINITY_DN17206_c0_g1~~TRINITY_DN17206_c0_g1_i1.p1  ORF type:complete len:443 (-),score=85.01 TRINITY_DN17206_c0_g1_i1:1-1329(-)
MSHSRERIMAAKHIRPSVWSTLILFCLLQSSLVEGSHGYGDPSMVMSFGIANETDDGSSVSVRSSALPSSLSLVGTSGGSTAGEDAANGATDAEGLVEEGTFEASSFSNMESMLHWAIENSDKEQLAAAAKSVSPMTPEEISLRRHHIKEVMDAMKMPSDAELMTTAIADVKNASHLSVDEVLRALQELLQLVEPIDNANDLHTLGGLLALADVLTHSDTRVRALTAWVLGTAAQNNPKLQQQYIDIGLLSALLNLAASAVDAEESSKALFALSAAIRNHEAAQEVFYAEGGTGLLIRFMNPESDARLRRKAVILVGALAEQLSEDSGALNIEESQQRRKAARDQLHSKTLLDSVLSLVVQVEDTVLLEKALVTLQSLVLSSRGDSSQHLSLKGYGAESALERCQELLQELRSTGDVEQQENVDDLEMLRREVALTVSEDQM